MKSIEIVLSLFAICSLAASQDSQCVGSGFARDPSDCSHYLQCTNGRLVEHLCPSGLNWNQDGQYCDWPSNTQCNGAVEPVVTTQATTKAPTTTKGTTQKGTTTKVTPTTEATPVNGGLVSEREFQLAAATKGGSPSRSYYTGFMASLEWAGIENRREAILFLAHATWETVGFIYTKEVVCQSQLSACLAAYPNEHGGLGGKVYYGRGMMQLTWDYNYRSASLYLYGDERLLINPDVVGDDPQVGWATAAWYWFANVHSRAGSFGSSLKAINGALECEGGAHAQNRYLRFMHYKQILEALGVEAPSDDDGWCTAW